jgi:hypothetical protein
MKVEGWKEWKGSRIMLLNHSDKVFWTWADFVAHMQIHHPERVS